MLATAKVMFASTFDGPDTEKGLQERFEAVMPLLALSLAGKNENQAQLVVEEFLNRMEVALREKAKVGDMGIGKRMRAYGGALNGRLQRYGQLLAARNRTGMALALAEHGVLGAEDLLRLMFPADDVHE